MRRVGRIRPVRRASSNSGHATPEREFAAFLSRFDPATASRARVALRAMRSRLPGAVELVYDNYNALVVGFGPTERASDAVFSIALYPRWVTLFFLQGATLSDPAHLLRGSGKIVRHVVLTDASDLDRPAVRELMRRALERQPLAGAGERKLVIRSVSAKQRPRRPVSERSPRRRPASGTRNEEG